MNVLCFFNPVAAPAMGGASCLQHTFAFHLAPSARPDRQAEREAKAIHELIEVYVSAGMPRAAAIEAAWRDCAECFASLFPCLSR
jgi:hypothetical protein